MKYYPRQFWATCVLASQHNYFLLLFFFFFPPAMNVSGRDLRNGLKDCHETLCDGRWGPEVVPNLFENFKMAAVSMETGFVLDTGHRYISVT